MMIQGIWQHYCACFRKLPHNSLKYIVGCVFPYLHGALHDRDSHDSILYGHSLSVHESGMGYKVEKNSVWGLQFY